MRRSSVAIGAHSVSAVNTAAPAARVEQRRDRAAVQRSGIGVADEFRRRTAARATPCPARSRRSAMPSAWLCGTRSMPAAPACSRSPADHSVCTGRDARSTLGWDDRWQAPPDGVVARIVAEHRGAYHAHGPRWRRVGRGHRPRVSSRERQARAADRRRLGRGRPLARGARAAPAPP